jgi:hypothetical protein
MLRNIHIRANIMFLSCLADRENFINYRWSIMRVLKDFYKLEIGM